MAAAATAKRILRTTSYAAMLCLGALAFGLTESTVIAESDAESRTYEAIKVRDMLTFDFMLAHPEGKDPDGVTPEEAEQIQNVVKYGADRLAEAQNPDGSIITHDSYAHITGSHALATWTLVACGRRTDDAVVKRAIGAMLHLSERRLPVPPAEPDRPAPAAMADGVEALQTYDASLVLMAMHAILVARQQEALDADAAKEREKGRQPKPAKPIDMNRTAAMVKAANAELGKLLTPGEAKVMKALHQTLLKRQALDGQWTYTSTPRGTGDSSNTHFAMLGLVAAFRMGFPAPPSFQLDRTEKFLIDSQQATGPECQLVFRDNVLNDTTAKKGKTSATRKPRDAKTQARSWKYVIGTLSQTKAEPESDATLSMGAAGVVVLSCVRYLRLEGQGSATGARTVAKLDPAMHSGLAWLSMVLDGRITAPKAGPKDPPEVITERRAQANRISYPGGNHWNAYTLLAVERAGILTGCDFFGGCEWYPVGARYLLVRLSDVQRPLPKQPEADAEKSEEEEDAGPAGGKAGKGGAKGGADAPKESGPTSTKAKVVAGRAMDSDFCLNLLFLKGYLDKSPKKKPGPTVTGKGRSESGGE